MAVISKINNTNKKVDTIKMSLETMRSSRSKLSKHMFNNDTLFISLFRAIRVLHFFLKQLCNMCMMVSILIYEVDYEPTLETDL